MDAGDRQLKARIKELQQARDKAAEEAERAAKAIERLGPTITPQLLSQFSKATREMLRNEDGTYRRDLLRAVAQRVEVRSTKELYISGCRVELLRTLAASNGSRDAALAVPTRVPKWRAMLDTRANYSFEIPIQKPRRRNTTAGSPEVSRFVSAGDDSDVDHQCANNVLDAPIADSSIAPRTRPLGRRHGSQIAATRRPITDR